MFNVLIKYLVMFKIMHILSDTIVFTFFQLK